jgi:lipopolysaccharide/colanic/teichoic acid biosynthesis glycosyltransferase
LSGREGRYRARRLHAVEHILDRHRDELASDREMLQNHHAIASEIHRLNGQRNAARRHAISAVRARPLDLRSWGRLGRLCLPARPGDRGVDGPYTGKRVVDLALCSIVALPALALGAVCALAIRMTSPGPVFFRQERIGMGGRPFVVWKFRTMIHGDNPTFPDATRITPVGRVLRRLSLDELPQLINVVKGEMSVVGPRPTLAYQVERYDEEQRRRLAVRPGLTGLAQVSGRNSLPWGERIRLDVQYVEQGSAALDLRILARTLQTMLAGEGVEGHPTDDPLARIDDESG